MISNPPKGTWYERGIHETVFGASTRSPIAIFLIPFMCAWSGLSLGGIHGSQIKKGEFDLTMSLFGLPFLIGTIILGSVVLMSLFGKVEVTLGQKSKVFLGVGPIGWSRYFDWHSIKTIREELSNFRRNGRAQMGIVLEGNGPRRKQALFFIAGLTLS